ncbi:MAG TPA: ATP-binding protein [Rhodocyclaceae bacterium]|nr:ATP-binding protein [Rhodocyclaceae bacterium]
MNESARLYFEILVRVLAAKDALALEHGLSEAFELGRAMVDRQLPLDEVTSIHHEAVVMLAQKHPEILLAAVAERLTRPLMEMTMSYTVAFLAQMDRRYKTMLNARLEQSRKLEAVGTLAAGISHDFNNLLGSVIGFAEMTGDLFAQDSAGKYNVDQILKASFRARDLVNRLLAFARQSPLRVQLIEASHEVSEAVAFLRSSLAAGIELRYIAPPQKLWVQSDPMQLQQIAMNLCINAADAMNDQGALIVVLASHGDELCLSVSDSGCGMTPELQERVFDPFFTTKAPGKGSGLGLSVVYGIATQLGGRIEVESRTSGERHGTEFRVWLPAAIKEGAGERID